MKASKEDWKRYKEEVLSRLTPEIVYGKVKRRKPCGNDWVMGLCPLHNDKTPSFAYHKDSLRWVCFAGCGKGSAFDFVMLTSGTDFYHTITMLGDRVGVDRPAAREKKPPIREELVKRWCRNLWQNEDVIRWLREKRGLSDETLRKYEIGWDPKRQRNTIPVRDERGNLVNVRLYNAKKKPKIINYTEGKWKYGSPARLYGADELQKDNRRQVVLAEGEWDRLVLQQEGFLAVTSTHGCSVFRPEWVKRFEGRDAVVIYDCDSEGKAAVNNIILKAFKEAVTSGGVRSIRVVALPLRGDKDDKDVTDYFQKRGFTSADLQRLIDETPAHSYGSEESEEETIRLDSFIEIERKNLVDQKVEVEVTVCGETSEAFHAVEEFRVTYCPRLKKGECFDCAETIKVPKGAREYIGSCMASDIQVTGMLRAFCCRYGQKPALEILKRTTVKEFFCHQKVDRITQTHDEEGNIVQIIDGKKQELVEKRVYFLSSEHPKPGNYRAVGWVKSHPRTQQVTMLIDTLEALEDDYEAFKVEENLALLRQMQKASVKDIVMHLRERVTRIYHRDELLLGILLTYCSPRWFKFEGKYVRGWLTTAIIGDSGTGKSQTFDRIAEHLGLGDIFSGLTGSRTGLAYALVEHKQKGWQVRIGRYPANSRKLLAVDEVQEVPQSQLKTIAKAMNEGFMQIDRVSSRGYESQTRLVMLGNPKKNRLLDEHHYGCSTLKAIFPKMMIRRLDLALFANSNDVDALEVMRAKREAAEAVPLSREAVRALVFWAWNLKPDDVLVTPEALEAIYGEIPGLAKTFGNATDVPLVTRYEADTLVARISAAFAVLDVSTDESFRRVVVRKKHVRDAARFLAAVYSAPNCGLDLYSNLCRQQEQIDDYDKVEAEFLRIIEREKHGGGENGGGFSRLLWALWTTGAKRDIQNSPVRRGDLADIVGCTPQYVSTMVGGLKGRHMVEAGQNGYTLQPKFVRFIKEFMRRHPGLLEQRARTEENSWDR